LPGAEVTVHASGSDEELPGVIVMPPARFLPESAGDGVLAINYLLVDTGLLPRDVERKVHVGDLVSFANQPFELAEDVISGYSLSVGRVCTPLYAYSRRNGRAERYSAGGTFAGRIHYFTGSGFFGYDYLGIVWSLTDAVR